MTNVWQHKIEREPLTETCEIRVEYDDGENSGSRPPIDRDWPHIVALIPPKHRTPAPAEPVSGVTVYDLRGAANALIDAIALPAGRDFRRAWDCACLMFGRYDAKPALLESLGWPSPAEPVGYADRYVSERDWAGRKYANLTSTPDDVHVIPVYAAPPTHAQGAAELATRLDEAIRLWVAECKCHCPRCLKLNATLLDITKEVRSLGWSPAPPSPDARVQKLEAFVSAYDRADADGWQKPSQAAVESARAAIGGQGERTCATCAHYEHGGCEGGHSQDCGTCRAYWQPQPPPAQDLGGHTVEVEHEAVKMAREAMQPPPAKGCGTCAENGHCVWGQLCREQSFEHWQPLPTPAAKPAASGNESGNGCREHAAEPGVHGKPITRREPAEPFKMPAPDCEPIVDTIARQAAAQRVVEAARRFVPNWECHGDNDDGERANNAARELCAAVRSLDAGGKAGG